MVTKKKNIIFDVGANEGSDGLSLALLFKNCQIFAFEPNKYYIKVIEYHKKKIEDTIGIKINNYKVFNNAISIKEGLLNFNISKNVGSHSLFEFNKSLYEFKRHSKDYEITQKTRVKVIKLSSFLKNMKFKRIKYLHCDAQGSDINVLKSLGNYIKYLDYGVVEVSTTKKEDLYKDSQNNLLNLKKFLKKKSFSITKITSNEPFINELNVRFKNNDINLNNFLNNYQKFKLKFYQKFIRKIIMGHYKTHLYKLLFRILNAKNN
tara:strand:+ start:219 stop:1007 length:789 start_codon:yes stop_codon:yes gene_type:complete